MARGYSKPSKHHRRYSKEKTMSDLTGQPGELRFTVEVKRAATGETETYELIGHIGQDEQPTEDNENGSDTLDSGA